MDRSFVIPPISPAAPGALYEQIVAGFRREIGAGRLAPGSPLPSFRALAEELLVSVITVKRAYEELEREGLIFRKQGLGTFVAEDSLARTREIRHAQAKEWFERAIRESQSAGLTPREIQELFQGLLHNRKGKS